MKIIATAPMNLIQYLLQKFIVKQVLELLQTGIEKLRIENKRLVDENTVLKGSVNGGSVTSKKFPRQESSHTQKTEN